MDGSRLARKARFLRWALNFYPPYLGAGVRVRHISADLRLVRVKMVLRWYNRNYVGTQFGGSLYSMVDPFFVLMLMENLGPDYIVWDKAANIEFVSPGGGARFTPISASASNCSTRFACAPPMAASTCRGCTSKCVMATVRWWRGCRRPST